jgi:sugar phosphate isomerase/epimerase
LILSLSNGIFSKCALEKNLAAVKALGFENVEFNMKSVEKQTDDSPLPAVKAVKQAGLNCLTVHAASLHVKEQGEVATAIYYGMVSVDFAKALKAPVMVVHSNVSRDISQSLRDKFLSEIFSELKPYAEQSGVKLALENLSYASSGYGKNVPEMEEILQVIGDDVGVTLDFCHAVTTGATASLVEKYAERLCNVHMSNRAHQPFTEETPQLTSFMSKLSECGYGGPITLELSHKSNLEEIRATKAVLENTLFHISV